MFVFLLSTDPKSIYEMCSFPETKVDGLVKKRQCSVLHHFNRTNLSRVYPKGQRLESSNFDPMQMWNCNVHMAALNYQTAGGYQCVRQAKKKYVCFRLHGPTYIFCNICIILRVRF